MNAKVETQKKIKAKFGVTFTENMDIAGMCTQWLALVPGEVKQKYPEVDGVMKALAPLMVLQQSLRLATTIANQIYQAAQTANVMPTPVTSAAVTAAKTAKETAKGLEEVQNIAMKDKAGEVFALLGQD